MIQIKTSDVKLSIIQYRGDVWLTEKELLRHISNEELYTVKSILQTMNVKEVNGGTIIPLMEAAVLIRNHGKYDSVKRKEVFIDLCELGTDDDD